MSVFQYNADIGLDGWNQVFDNIIQADQAGQSWLLLTTDAACSGINIPGLNRVCILGSIGDVNRTMQRSGRAGRDGQLGYVHMVDDDMCYNSGHDFKKEKEKRIVQELKQEKCIRLVLHNIYETEGVVIPNFSFCKNSPGYAPCEVCDKKDLVPFSIPFQSSFKFDDYKHICYLALLAIQENQIRDANYLFEKAFSMFFQEFKKNYNGQCVIPMLTCKFSETGKIECLNLSEHKRCYHCFQHYTDKHFCAKIQKDKICHYCAFPEKEFGDHCPKKRCAVPHQLKKFLIEKRKIEEFEKKLKELNVTMNIKLLPATIQLFVSKVRNAKHLFEDLFNGNVSFCFVGYLYVMIIM